MKIPDMKYNGMKVTESFIEEVRAEFESIEPAAAMLISEYDIRDILISAERVFKKRYPLADYVVEQKGGAGEVSFEARVDGEES